MSCVQDEHAWIHSRNLTQHSLCMHVEEICGWLVSVQALIAHGTPKCSYSKAWTTSWAMIEVWERTRGPEKRAARKTPGEFQAEPLQKLAVEEAPSMVVVNGQCFLIVSDRCCFVQGRCAVLSPELSSVREHLRQGSIFMDFQGEMMGYTGEIYFVVIKPMIKSTSTLTATATEPEPLEGPGFILDMQSEAVKKEHGVWRKSSSCIRMYHWSTWYAHVTWSYRRFCNFDRFRVFLTQQFSYVTGSMPQLAQRVFKMGWANCIGIRVIIAFGCHLSFSSFST